MDAGARPLGLRAQSKEHEPDQRPPKTSPEPDVRSQGSFEALAGALSVADGATSASILQVLGARVGNEASQLVVQRAAAPAATTPPATAPKAAHAGPAIGPEIDGSMRGDVDAIVSMLQEQYLATAEEQHIVDLVEGWSKLDDDYRATTGYTGTDNLDKFLFYLKTRGYDRRTARSGWIKQHPLVYDDLWRELGGARLERFRAIVAKSKNQGTGGPEGEAPENFWKTMGKQEAIGTMGMAKGLSTGGAEVLDVAGWAMTKSANMALDPIGRAAGTDLTLEPSHIADQVSAGFDDMGDRAFGKDQFSQGDSLFLGMNAAQIGNAGGKIVWMLTMLGAGTAAQEGTQAKMLLKVLDITGRLKTVDDEGHNMVALLEQMDADGNLNAKGLLGSPEFHVQAIKLAGAIVAAVVGGMMTKEGAATASQKILEQAVKYLKLAEMVAKVARIMEIAFDAKMTPDQKEAEAGKVVVELITDAVGAVGDKAAESDEARAKDVADKKAGAKGPAAGQTAFAAFSGDKLEIDSTGGQVPPDKQQQMHYGELDLDSPAGPSPPAGKSKTVIPPPPEGFEPTAYPPPVGRRGRTRPITRDEQLTGISTDRLGPLDDWHARQLGPNPSVQAGHRVPASTLPPGAPHVLAIEDTRMNWETGAGVTNKPAILVDGAYVDKESALNWARSGNYPGLTEDVVNGAPVTQGWVSAPGLSREQAQQSFMREQLQVLLSNPNHPFRFLIVSFRDL